MPPRQKLWADRADQSSAHPHHNSEGGRGVHPLLPVRSTGAIPKEQLSSAMRELGRITVKAPVDFGQVVLANWNGGGFHRHSQSAEGFFKGLNFGRRE